jgi:hypothetical protein
MLLLQGDRGYIPYRLSYTRLPFARYPDILFEDTAVDCTTIARVLSDHCAIMSSLIRFSLSMRVAILS